MLARIVEHWLSRASELTYQTAFAQLLANEGHRILHGPVHHPYEHGKDIVALHPDGSLHAFQLKAGDIGLTELEKIQGQLFALAGTSVSYPGVEPPRLPNRAYLVTNGRLTAPARDRLGAFNEANRQRGFVTIESVECEQLVGRFVAAHEHYLPSELLDLNAILRLVLADGRGPFPIRDFADMIWSVLCSPGIQGKPAEVSRALGAAVLLTSYGSGAWEREQDHLRVAEAWLVLAFSILRRAEEASLSPDMWEPSLELASTNARNALGRLVDDAVSAEDLVIPDIVEGLVYPARAALVCGYAAAYLLSEQTLRNADELRARVHGLLVREVDYFTAAGEAGTPHLLMVATALDVMQEPALSAKIVFQWARSLTVANAPGSEGGVPDPYHPIGEVLLDSVGGDSDFIDEQFIGRAYTLHVAIEWLARRDLRPLIAALWPNITKLLFAEFAPTQLSGLLAHHVVDGTQLTWAPAAPASWTKLKTDARSFSQDQLPSSLWSHLYLLPYLPLLYPYRLTGAVGKAVDYLSVGRCDFVPALLGPGTE